MAMGYLTNVQVICAALAARTPLYLEGPPGGGKTATVTAVARWLKRPLVTIIGATRDRTDFGGWPRYDERRGRVALHPFPWVEALLEAGESGILFIDELNANEEIFPVLLRVLAERYIGDLPFAGDVLAAGNPEALSVAGLMLPPPVANRVIHYRWQVAAHEWAAGMRRGFEQLYPPPPEVAPEVVKLRISALKQLVAAYIERHPEALFELPAQLDQLHGPWPSPRSWELLARFVGAAQALGFDEEVQALGAYGAVGEHAYGFLHFLQKLDLPTPEEVLSNFDQLPQREDAAYVTLMAVASYVAEQLNPERWEQAWRLLQRVAEARRADVAAQAAAALIELYRGLPASRRRALRFPPEAVLTFGELVAQLEAFEGTGDR